MTRKPTRKTLPKNLDDLLDAAAKDNDYAPVYAALEKCVPDARGGYGKGTLLANGKCTLELARWAIERGTDINAGDTWDRTPLHDAARARFGQVLTPEQLMELGADIHAKSYDGMTPLFSAADGKNLASSSSTGAASTKITSKRPRKRVTSCAPFSGSRLRSSASSTMASRPS